MTDDEYTTVLSDNSYNNIVIKIKTSIVNATNMLTDKSILLENINKYELNDRTLSYYGKHQIENIVMCATDDYDFNIIKKDIDNLCLFSLLHDIETYKLLTIINNNFKV